MQQSSKKVKYILVTGGVLSGIGKGVISSSVGRMLKEMGFIVTSIKIDPYINIDAGTMSPFEHGEVYVLDDGGEVDLDLGNYERFLDITLTKDNNITTGKIYNAVIQKERKGLYLGKTVQVVPHICDEIQEWIERVAHRVPSGKNADSHPDFCVIELGGTIGDIESMPFVEAMRQFQFRVGKENFCNIHVSLVPSMGVVGEQKTKPTQNTVRELRALGISPDFIACRSEEPLTEATKLKISSFCHVPPQHVIGVHDVPSVYHVPILLVEQNVHQLITERLALKQELIPNPEGSKLLVWRSFAEKYATIMNMPSQLPAIEIAIVGKYTGLIDSYTSIDKALKHAAVAVDRKVVIHWIESTDLEDPELGKKGWDIIKNKAHGLLIPGGFGDRGVEGKIAACNYARLNNLPFFGICLGFQIAVIEFARNVLGWKDATSEEFVVGGSKAGKNVIISMPELDKENMGGTMRLGKRRSIFKSKDCQIAHLYNDADFIDERHRHRYEVNPELSKEIDANGLQFVAQDETGQRMEIFELKNHAYFVGTQYHPEFLSRPNKPSAPFVGLLKAALKNTDK